MEPVETFNNRSETDIFQSRRWNQEIPVDEREPNKRRMEIGGCSLLLISIEEL
jgi:hypothetical protein